MTSQSIEEPNDQQRYRVLVHDDRGIQSHECSYLGGGKFFFGTDRGMVVRLQVAMFSFSGFQEYTSRVEVQNPDPSR